MSTTPTITETTPPAPPADWLSTLPDDLKASPVVEKFKGKAPADVLKSYVELEKRAGSAIKVPKADSPEGDWDSLFTRLGRPESADKYDLKRPENLPQGMTYDENIEKGFRDIAHKAGLLPRQAQAIFEGYNALQVERHKAITASMEAGMGDLQKEWGNDYDKNVSIAKRAVKELGDESLTGFMNESGLGNHPQMVRLFAKLGADRKEDTFVEGDGGNKNASSVEAIDAQIEEQRKIATDKLKTPDQQTEAMNKMLKLREQRIVASGGTVEPVS